MDSFISKIREVYLDNPDFLGDVDGVLTFLIERYTEYGGQYEICFDFKNLLAFKPDFETVAAALLVKPYKKDLFSDTEIIDNFGMQVFEMVNSVARISSLSFEENNTNAQIDVLKKMFLTMAKDLRVILILLTHRLYLMENIVQMDVDIRKLKALETLHLYVPIADRLGVHRMKIKLEDISFRYAFYDDYEDVLSQLNNFNKSREKTILLFKRKLEDFLLGHDIEAEISGRVKSSYSIYKKIQKKGFNTIDDIYDIFAMRIVVENSDQEEELYRILGLIHSQWEPIADRFKDYVAMPKPNGYRSLHTVVRGLNERDQGQVVEIQIRNRLMHTEAEYGMASHWLYKKVGSNAGDRILTSHARWLKGLSDLDGMFGAEFEIMKKVELDIFKDRVFVLTPRGEVKDLPTGSTPIDFAYSVHTDVGNRCYMAKVNGEAKPLVYKLENGDVVDIVTRQDSEPKLDWLSVVKTSLAKSSIKSWYASFDRDLNVRKGKELVNKTLRKFGMEPLDQNYSIFKEYLGKNLTISERETLLEEIGKGSQFAADILRRVFPEIKEESVRRKKSRKSACKKNESVSKILIGGDSFLPFRFAKCCKPKAGDDILAYVTRGNFVSVHRKDCKILKNLNSERFIEADFLD